jgi:hypothetical protein
MQHATAMPPANTMSQIRQLLKLEQRVVTALLNDIDEKQIAPDVLKIRITDAMVLMRDMTNTMTDWASRM